MTTTATALETAPLRRNRLLQGLCAGTALVIAVSAKDPLMVGDWLLENLLVTFLLVTLITSYQWLRLSDLSYLLIFAFLCIHEWGAHHKYADVPLGEWLKPLLQTNRNHYDRIAHFSFGLLLAYPFREVLIRAAGVRGWWAYYLPVDMALALGAAYEILEAIVASIVSPDTAEAFIGLQGDVWDTQKDIALAGLGSIITMAVVAAVRAIRYKSI
jgi:putative membrane protein